MLIEGILQLNNFQFVAAKSVPPIKLQTGVDGVLGMSLSYVVQPNKPQLPLYFPTFFDTAGSAYSRMFTFYPDVMGNTGATLTVGGDYTGVANVAKGISTFSAQGSVSCSLFDDN